MITITDKDGTTLNLPENFTFKVTNASIDVVNLTADIRVLFENDGAKNSREFRITEGINGTVNGNIEDAAKALLSSFDWYDVSKYGK